MNIHPIGRDRQLKALWLWARPNRHVFLNSCVFNHVVQRHKLGKFAVRSATKLRVFLAAVS